MANPGAYPLDANSDIGRFRLVIGDVNSTPLQPPIEGQQDYNYFSDEEITAFLSAGSVNRAIGTAYLQWAGAAAAESKVIKDFDLQVDLSKRSKDYRELAGMYFQLADGEDFNAGANEEFLVADTGTDHSWYQRPEGAAHWAY